MKVRLFTRSDFRGDCPLVVGDGDSNTPSTPPRQQAAATFNDLNADNTALAPAGTADLADLPPADPEMLCFGEIVFPPRCDEGSECKYRLSWAYTPDNDQVGERASRFFFFHRLRVFRLNFHL